MLIPLFEQINLYVISSFTLTLIVFILIGNAWNTIINLLDPEYFLLPSITKDIKDTFTKCFVTTQEKEISPQEKMAELRDMMEQAMSNMSKIDPEEKYYRITKQEILPAFNKILLLKELIIIYVRNNQTHLFASTITQLENCIFHYIKLRHKYVINFDDFLIEFSDDVNDIIDIVDKQSNIHYQRRIWRFIRSICYETCSIENLQYQSGYNYISSPYTGILNIQFYKDLVNHNNDSAFEIARCLGEIGSFWASKQIINSASDILKKLSLISETAYIKKRTEITYIAREHISKIFFNLILYFDVKKNYEFVFNNILSEYKKLLQSNALYSTSHIDFIFWYDPDITKDKSIAAIIRLLLFPASIVDEKEYDLLQRTSQDTVEKLLQLLLETMLTKKDSQIGFLSQVHQIGLYFLGFLHHQISTDILINYSSLTIPNNSQKENVDRLLLVLLDFYFEQLRNRWINNDSIVSPFNEITHSFFSLIIMDIYWSILHNKDRVSIINERIQKYFWIIKKDIPNLKMSRDEQKALYEIGIYFNKIDGMKEMGRKIKYLARKAFNNNTDFYSHSSDKVNFIKRPMHTFNQALFYGIDKEVFNVT